MFLLQTYMYKATMFYSFIYSKEKSNIKPATMRKNQSSGLLTRSDINPSVPSQKKARSLKFWIEEGVYFYYPCSINKGADQLCSYCTADLRLCFCLNKLMDFLCGSSFLLSSILVVANKRDLWSFCQVSMPDVTKHPWTEDLDFIG